MYIVTISARCFGVKRFMTKIVVNCRFRNTYNQITRFVNIKVIRCFNTNRKYGAPGR
ncbi:unnamed protein product [Acanthoscelides obtectus]|uniref:Uncharacterized protein n=1 Tax=Acanthoscelides obtectus TaxID=200917 RepID=A0A9P0M979_ACAOB|nr:unnamed protein product [Acanthoscelides obtectus]CAK1681740.1 hypothetical protein AOBTE_LOCUS33254 [Acanthoscelides obtectus]